MADGITVRRVRDIVRSDPSRRYIVVSAPGKRYSGDEKVTDLLYEAHTCLMKTGDCGAPFQKIKRRFFTIAEELGLKDDFDVGFLLSHTELQIVQRRSQAFTVSRGEFLMGKLVAAFFKMPFIDAEELIRFCADGTFDGETTYPLASSVLKEFQHAVVPGFYGADEAGGVRTFSRGGSDISGAIISRAVKADLYENWTDVCGFLVSDPRIVDSPARIERLTFGELRSLSRMGASVLHLESVAPVREAGIPVCIRDTFRPKEAGTLILPSAGKGGQPVTGIAGKKSYIGVRIGKYLLKSTALKELLGALELLKADCEQVMTGIDTLLFVFEEEQMHGKLNAFLKVVRESVKPDTLEIFEKLALISAVGQGMNESVEASARMLRALAQTGVQAKIILKSSVLSDLIVGVDGKDFERALRAVYDEFFRE